MTWGITKVIIAGGIISFTSWLSGKRPALAGFLLALPISSMIALLLSYTEYKDAEKSVEFAKSIFFAVPLSLVFFIPFLFANRLRWPFPWIYISGAVLLIFAYGLHRRLVGSPTLFN